MADNPNSVPVNRGSELALPVAAIVCIAIGAYIVLVMIILVIRQILMQRGWCKETFACCGKEGELQCCDCCVTTAESCNCCHNPSIAACMDSICPARRQLDCADIIMCNFCDNGCCNSQEPLCDCEWNWDKRNYRRECVCNVHFNVCCKMLTGCMQCLLNNLIYCASCKSCMGKTCHSYWLQNLRAQCACLGFTEICCGSATSQDYCQGCCGGNRAAPWGFCSSGGRNCEDWCKGCQSFSFKEYCQGSETDCKCSPGLECLSRLSWDCPGCSCDINKCSCAPCQWHKCEAENWRTCCNNLLKIQGCTCLDAPAERSCKPEECLCYCCRGTPCPKFAKCLLHFCSCCGAGLKSNQFILFECNDETCLGPCCTGQDGSQCCICVNPHYQLNPAFAPKLSLCKCGTCDCTCNCQPECENINCCCFTIGVKGGGATPRGPSQWQQGYGQWGPGYAGGTAGYPVATGAPGSNISWGFQPGIVTSSAYMQNPTQSQLFNPNPSQLFNTNPSQLLNPNQSQLLRPNQSQLFQTNPMQSQLFPGNPNLSQPFQANPNPAQLFQANTTQAQPLPTTPVSQVTFQNGAYDPTPEASQQSTTSRTLPPPPRQDT